MRVVDPALGHFHGGHCYTVVTWAGRMTRVHIMAGEDPRHFVCERE